jgi:putative flippase GtrA
VVTGTIDGAPTAAPPPFRERHPLARQLGRYVVAGGVGTGVNAGVYLLLRTGWDAAIAANLVALVVSTLVSTEVNRRFTFDGAHGHPWRAHVQTAGMVGFYAVYSSAVLLALAALVDDPTPLLESAVVSAASVLGGAGRFLLLRFWVFAGEADRRGSRPDAAARRRRAVRVALAATAGVALVFATACVPLG